MVELGLSPDLRRGDSAAETIASAHAAGFDAVGLGARQCDATAAAALDAAGMRCREVMVLLVGREPDEIVSSAESLCSAVEVVGADWVATVFFARPAPEVLAALGRASAMLGEIGAGLATECSPLGPVATIADGLEVVEAIGHERAGVLVDSWHFGRSTDTWRDLEALPLERLAYVQFADALPPVSDDLMTETIDRRALPGLGELDLHRFATTLLGRGFDGLVMAEVLSTEQRALPPAAAARTAFASTARYWR